MPAVASILSTCYDDFHIHDTFGGDSAAILKVWLHKDISDYIGTSGLLWRNIERKVRIDCNTIRLLLLSETPPVL